MREQLVVKGIVGRAFNLVYCFPNAIFTSVCFHSIWEICSSHGQGGEDLRHHRCLEISIKRKLNQSHYSIIQLSNVFHNDHNFRIVR